METVQDAIVTTVRADASNKAIILTANQIKKQLDIPLSNDEQIKEEQFLANYGV